VDLQTLNRELEHDLAAFAWDQWAQIGIAASVKGHSTWAQDPEALILFTLEVARSEPRLFDEMLDWMLLNEALLSVRRLRAMRIDDTDRALLAATLAWLAVHRPRARLAGRDPEPPPELLMQLFRPPGPSAENDPSFAAAGFARTPLEPSHKSRVPDSSKPINLAFRLREILGVGIRAEVVRVLLGIDAPWVTVQALARASAFSKRNVQDALTDLAAAGVVRTVTVGNQGRYAADHEAWAALLREPPDGLAAHLDWPQLLGVLRMILRFTADPALEGLSDYLQASRIRDLLESIRPLLAFAGIPTNISPRPERIGRDLEDITGRLLGILGASSFSQQAN
jgi:hypothetical protein